MIRVLFDRHSVFQDVVQPRELLFQDLLAVIRDRTMDDAATAEIGHK